MLVEGFFRQTKGPLQRLSHRLLGPLAGLGEGVHRGGPGVWKSVTSPVASHHRKTKTHSSPWEQSPAWGPVFPANCLPRHHGLPSAAAVCVLGPQPPEVSGGLRALLAAPAVCNALPSDCPRGQLLCPSEPRCPTSSDMPPPPSVCSNHPITLHPGTSFPSLHSFLMSL